MEYVHVGVEASQSTKKKNTACGDVYAIDRTDNSTIVILADGLGSGVVANIYAEMCVARLKGLINSGFSIHQAFFAVVKTMEQAIAQNLPYSVFSIARIINDGLCLVLSYEMPAPIIISNGIASTLDQRMISKGNSKIYEANCFLNIGDGILLVSDGVTQAGLGRDMPNGLGIEAVCKLINGFTRNGRILIELPYQLDTKIKSICKNINVDDVSSVLAYTRVGSSVNLFTGPPTNKARDNEVAAMFMKLSGYKVVCGGTSSKIFSEYLDKKIEIDNSYSNHFTPPMYSIEGLDLVTEGAVTLNQLYNVFDEDRDLMDDFNPVTELYDYLINADKITFFVGNSNNLANNNIKFVQQGLLARKRIVPLIAEKLRSMGKLVLIEGIE